MSLTEEVKKKIRESQAFIFMPTKTETLNSQKMLEQLKYAMLIEKHIIFWFVPSRKLVPKPREAEGYPDFSIVVGDAKKMAEKLKNLFPRKKPIHLVVAVEKNEDGF